MDTPDLPDAPTLEQQLDAWFARHFHGLGPRLETWLYNRLHAAFQELKQLLGVAPAPAASSAPEPAAVPAPGPSAPAPSVAAPADPAATPPAAPLPHPEV